MNGLQIYSDTLQASVTSEQQVVLQWLYNIKTVTPIKTLWLICGVLAWHMFGQGALNLDCVIS